VIWTHDHADHTHGIDDLRQLMHARGGEPVRGFARPFTLEQLQLKLRTTPFSAARLPPDRRDRAAARQLISIGDIRVTVADQPHGGITSAGLRFDSNGKSIGYATDFHEMTSEMRALYAGLDIWVVDALRRAPHPTHPIWSGAGLDRGAGAAAFRAGSYGSVDGLYASSPPSCPQGSNQALTAWRCAREFEGQRWT
jgi:phosphoribosyl 1,2-cyclic phosphate phosphodiesterase